MTIKSVIGLGFGDEGKGRIVSSLAHQAEASCVVRYSGGQQAAHHVMHKDGKDHVFSGFGSNSFEDNSITIWDKSCVFYPRAFLNELNALNEKGISPNLKIHKKCPLVTPYDIAYNRIRNSKLQHGSVGVGIGTTIDREEDGISFLVEDLEYESVKIQKLKVIKNYYENKGKRDSIIASHKDADIFYKDTCKDVIDDYLEECLEFQRAYTGTKHNATIISENKKEALIDTICDNSETDDDPHMDLIFEGSQGILLDPIVGFFPHVTRSTILPEIPYYRMSIEAFDYEQESVMENWLVHRAYTTRHGNGPMTHEDNKFPDNPFELNVTGEHQGHFRKGILDLDLLQYAIDKTIEHTVGKNYLVLTCMDVLPEKPELIMNGKVLDFKNREDFLDFIHTHIENIDNIFTTDSPYAEDYPVKFK